MFSIRFVSFQWERESWCLFLKDKTRLGCSISRGCIQKETAGNNGLCEVLPFSIWFHIYLIFVCESIPFRRNELLPFKPVRRAIWLFIASPSHWNLLFGLPFYFHSIVAQLLTAHAYSMHVASCRLAGHYYKMAIPDHFVRSFPLLYTSGKIQKFGLEEEEFRVTPFILITDG